MPESSIQQVTFQQEWFAGDTTIFHGDEETDVTPSLFETEVDLPAIPPLAERVQLSVTAIGNASVDGDITYGGNFKPNMNNIEIVGDLTTEQKAFILSSLSVTTGAPNSTDIFEFFTTPPAAAGAQRFTINIPYQEQDIDFPQNDATFSFIDFWQDSGAPVTDNTILVVNNDNDKFIQIKAGILSNNQQSLILENIVVSGRLIDNLSAESTSTEFIVNYEENIQNQFIFTLTGFPLLPDILFYTSTRHSVYYEYTCQATTTGIIVSNILGRAKKITGSTPTTSVVHYYLQHSARGLKVTRTIPVDRSSITYDVTWSSANITLRRNYLFTLRNNYVFPITVRHIITGEGNTSWQISGRDGSGQFYDLIESVGSLSVAESIAVLDGMFNSVPDWAGNIQITYQTFAEEDFGPARADWIEGFNEVINAGSSLTPDYYTFPFDTVAPAFTATVNFGDVTLEEAMDVAGIFEAEYGFRLPAITLGNQNPNDAWLDETFAVLAIRSSIEASNGSNSLASMRATLAGTFNPVELADFGFPWNLSIADRTYLYANYTNIGEMTTAINADLSALGRGSNGLNIVASAGLFFDSVPASYLIPSSNDAAESIDPILSERYTIEAGSNGRIDTPVLVSNSYTKSSYSIQLLANAISSDFQSLLDARPLNNLGNESASTISVKAETDLSVMGSSSVYSSAFTFDDTKTYNLLSFLDLDSLIAAMNSDWNAKDIFFARNSAVDGRIDAVPTLIEQFGTDPNDPEIFVINITTPTLPGSLVGILSTTVPPDPVIETVSFDFNINFATGGNPNSPTGIQVALGGFQIDGIDFFSQSPNTFFEPVFNTIFDIQFNTFEADKIYLLVKTREDIEGATFTANITDFAGLARFSNGAPSQLLSPFKSTDPIYLTPWAESDLGGGMPVLLSVDGISTRIDVAIDQLTILDSINVSIINRPESLNEFAFLARNRTNENQSMLESRSGRVFGLALDNRGAWDVLIGPEAILREVTDGEFDYLSRSYDRDFLDTDEGYDFEFFNLGGLPTEVQDAISISPVPGYPQVWALRIDPGVKRYLGAIRRGATPNSLDGCSIDIDLFVTGRISGIEGICRVTIYHDYRCVYDVGLCDFFWNLTDPPEPEPPELIEDNLLFTYQNLIDCQRLDVDSDGSVNEFGLPILITIDNVPTFENGNAALLIKTVYTPEIQGFYWPIDSDFNFIQDGSCNFLNENVSLVQRLNRPSLYLPGDPTPITDPFQIIELISTEDSYMYVQPRFQFPIQDINKECGPGEFVLTGLGYQFKNWQNGFRSDDVLVGANLVLGGDVFAAPEIDFCYRYYYNQDEG